MAGAGTSRGGADPGAGAQTVLAGGGSRNPASPTRHAAVMRRHIKATAATARPFIGRARATRARGGTEAAAGRRRCTCTAPPWHPARRRAGSPLAVVLRRPHGPARTAVTSPSSSKHARTTTASTTATVPRPTLAATRDPAGAEGRITSSTGSTGRQAAAFPDSNAPAFAPRAPPRVVGRGVGLCARVCAGRVVHSRRRRRRAAVLLIHLWQKVVRVPCAFFNCSFFDTRASRRRFVALPGGTSSSAKARTAAAAARGSRRRRQGASAPPTTSAFPAAPATGPAASPRTAASPRRARAVAESR